jgi:hypothetical protein
MPEQDQPQMVCQLSFVFSLSVPVSNQVIPDKKKFETIIYCDLIFFLFGDRFCANN